MIAKNATRSKPKLTPEQLAAKRLQSHIEGYRKLVARVADGEDVTDDELSMVGIHLEAMGLPLRCWDQDIEALKRYRHASAQHQALTAKNDAQGQVVHDLQAKLKTLEAQIQQVRGDIYSAGEGHYLKLVNYGRSMAELELGHGHLLGSVEHAVHQRLHARPKPVKQPEPTKAELSPGWIS